eukprot:3123187-Lingulodinium_polyedra.AAC.1
MASLAALENAVVVLLGGASVNFATRRATDRLAFVRSSAWIKTSASRPRQGASMAFGHRSWRPWQRGPRRCKRP